MIGTQKIRSMIPQDIREVNIALMKNHPGIMVECGVWRGGMMSEMMKISELVIGYDSFEGLPEPGLIDGEAALKYANDKSSRHYYNNCRADFDEVDNYLKSCGSNYKLIKGWYSPRLFESCPDISVLRIDCDWHDSVNTALHGLWGKLKSGGLVIIDDYVAYDGCAIAVNNFIADSPVRIREFKGVTYFIK